MLWSEFVEAAAPEFLPARLATIQVLDALPHLAWLALPDGTVVYCNPRWYAYTGATTADMNSGGLINFIHPDDRDTVLEMRGRGVELGVAHDVQLRWLGYDGRYRWFLDSAVALSTPAGEVQGWIGTSIDVDAQLRAQQARPSSRDDFELLGTATNDLLWEWDLASGRMRYNSTFWQLVGEQPNLTTETVEFWLSLVHPSDTARIRWELQTSMTTTKPLITSEYRLRRADGSYLHILDRACVVHNAQSLPVRMVGAMKDISNQRLRPAPLG